jgi:tetratricopeptide (TPR) repeat protein
MFKHLFASMNEMLDEVTAHYPAAAGIHKRELQEKLRALKSMSDTFIEEWLLFEEKLGAFYQLYPPADSTDPLDPELGNQRSDEFIRGQGYYKLLMFEEAIREFTGIVGNQPDFTLARIYLAMSFLRKGDVSESYSHFYFLSQLTENIQMKAISYNAMGCIQIQQNNMDKAIEYFNLAFHTDPHSVEPLMEMGLCCEKKGELHFFPPSRK